MKTFRSLLFVMMTLLVVFSTCKKEEEPPAVENQDASDLIVNSFESDVYGISSQLEEAIRLTEGLLTPSNCGFSGDSTINNHYGGVAVQYQYTFKWNYTINCSATTPSVVDVGNTCTGTCSTSLLTSNFSSVVDWTIIGLAASSTEYIIDGSYIRTGDFTSKRDAKHSFSSVLTIALSDVKMVKSTLVASSGTATISLVCHTDAGEEFTFAGSLVFNGNQNCTLTLEDKVYSIQL